MNAEKTSHNDRSSLLVMMHFAATWSVFCSPTVQSDLLDLETRQRVWHGKIGAASQMTLVPYNAGNADGWRTPRKFLVPLEVQRQGTSPTVVIV